MYIGRLGDGSQNDDGIYVLLKEVMDNSIDEFKMGAGKRIEGGLQGNSLSYRQSRIEELKEISGNREIWHSKIGGKFLLLRNL